MSICMSTPAIFTPWMVTDFANKELSQTGGRKQPSLDTEDFALVAARQLLTDPNTDWTPDAIVDCRSALVPGGASTSPALAANLGLPTAPQLSLPMKSYSEGLEPVEALLLLYEPAYPMGKGALVCSAGSMNVSVVEEPEDRLPVSSAGAAFGVSASPFAFGKSFHVLSGTIVASLGTWDNTVSQALDEATRLAGVARKSIQWCIAHRFSHAFLAAIRSSVFDTQLPVRKQYSEFNFGCVDPLVSLHEIFVVEHDPPGGTGVVVFAGLCGAVGLIVVNSQSVALWRRYVSGKVAYTSQAL